jgi:hypothetical protein
MKLPWTTLRRFEEAVQLCDRLLVQNARLIAGNVSLRRDVGLHIGCALELRRQIDAADSEFLRQVGAKVE